MNTKFLFVLALAASMCMGCDIERSSFNVSQQPDVVARCGSLWNNAVAYEEGETISYGASNFTSVYWNKGKHPLTFSGAPGSGQPWKSSGSCSTATV